MEHIKLFEEFVLNESSNKTQKFTIKSFEDWFYDKYGSSVLKKDKYSIQFKISFSPFNFKNFCDELEETFLDIRNPIYSYYDSKFEFETDGMDFWGLWSITLQGNILKVQAVD